MKRRLRYAATAFGAFLVPACAGVPSAPMAVRPSVQPPNSSRTTTAFGNAGKTVAAKMPRIVDKFAENWEEPSSSIARSPAALPDAPLPASPNAPTIASPYAPLHTPPLHASPVFMSEPAPAVKVAVDSTPSPLIAAPQSVTKPPANTHETPRPEPVADGDGVIRANWPVIKGPTPLAEPAGPMLPPPPSELIPPANPDADSAVRPKSPARIRLRCRLA